MVRNYIRKTNRSQISEEDIRRAISDIIHKRETATSASVKYNLKRQTINSRLRQIKRKKGVTTLQVASDSGQSSDNDVLFPFQNKYASTQVFTKEEENDLVLYLKKCSVLQHGLTFPMFKKFAFDYATVNQIKYPKSWNIKKEAGEDWMSFFMKRNTSLSLRKPENISLARQNAFNAEAVDEFFHNLSDLYIRHKFAAKDIYNLDETGVNTVMDSPKVIAEKGRRTVSQVVSAERGSLTTIVGIISASGTFLPPIYVFPRIRKNERFLTGALNGSLALNSKSGWMVAELFLDVLKHIKTNTNCAVDRPILLLLDNHCSHCSLEAIIFCRENGIVMLSFPPHTSHKLQPLDVTVFGPFKRFCKTAFNEFMVNNKRPLTIYDVAAVTTQPFLKAVCPENVVKGFSVTGIFPLNSNIFGEADFLGHIDMNENQTPVTEQCNFSHQPSSQERLSDPGPQLYSPGNSNKDSTTNVTPEIIRPYPKINRKINNKRSGKSRIFTDSPEKERIEIMQNKKNEKEKKSICKKSESKTRGETKENKVKRVINYSSSEEDIEVPFADSDDMEEFEDDESPTVLPNTLTDDEILNVNDYILVKFVLKESVFYVGQIISIEGSTSAFTIKFFRKCRGVNSFVEPNLEDIALVSRSDIEMKLPEPTHPPGTSRSINKYVFNINLSGYYIK